jgi:hypothetical protein
MKKFLGNWYLYIADDQLANPGDNCFKNNHTLVGNDSLQMVQQWFELVLKSFKIIFFFFDFKNAHFFK